MPRSLPPFSFTDDECKCLRGFCVDLAVLLAGKMGAKINFSPMDPPQLRKALADREIDAIICLAMPKGIEEGFSLLETTVVLERKYFVNTCCLTITCHKDLPGKTVALVKGSEHLDIDTESDSIHFIEVGSPLEALKLVNSGDAHVYIAYSRLTALYLIQRNGFKNIKEVGITIESVPLSLVLLEDNAELLKGLSVSYGQILEKGDYDLIYHKWLGKGIQVSVWEKYIKAIFLVLGLVASVLLVLVFWNRMLKRKVNKITYDLQLSELKYRELIESSPEMICLISRDGRLNLCNKIVLENLGYDEQEAASLLLRDIVVSEKRPEVGSFIDSVFQEGFAKHEFIFEGKTGNAINVEMIATTVKGSGGAENLACCFSRDITERRRLEDELIQSERLAIMGHMAAGIAHEINNPLGIILANTEDALYDGLDAQGIQDCLNSIERNAVRAGKIIENLLSFTRPSPFARVPIDLGQLIDESLSFLKQHFKRKEIRVERHDAEEPMTFLGDDNQIQQLLINLILNSIEAIEQQGTIKVSTALRENNSKKVIHLEIEDTGMGIPENQLPQIFDPFFTAGKKKGFGLGLFISKRIVEKHNGTIIASSQEGHGTVMVVELPVQPESRQVAPADRGMGNA